METTNVNIVFQSLIGIWLLIIAYIDFKTQYIYDRDLFGVFILVISYQIYNDNFFSAVTAVLFAASIGFLIFLLAYIAYQEEAFGLGDVYLLGILGCYWSWPTIIHFLCFAFLLGGIIGAAVLIITRNKKYRLSFAPILIFSIPLYYLCDNPTIYMIFSKFLK